MKKTVRNIILYGATLALTIAVFPFQMAHATSAYDNEYSTTNSVFSGATNYNASCNLTDLTKTWQSYILDSSKWRSGQDWSAARNSLMMTLNDPNGQWGVSEEDTTASPSAGGGYTKYVDVYWSTDSTAQLTWGADSLNDVAYSGAHISSMLIGCSNYIYGNGGGDPVIFNTYSSVDTTSALVSRPLQVCGWNSAGPAIWCSANNLFLHNINANLPIGYAGAAIQTAPAMPAVNGDVQCAYGNNTITNVAVVPITGAAGSAFLTNDGVGGQDYKYFLSEDSPYQLAVTCDGTTFLSSIVSTNLYDTYNWMCTYDESLQFVCSPI